MTENSKLKIDESQNLVCNIVGSEKHKQNSTEDLIIKENETTNFHNESKSNENDKTMEDVTENSVINEVQCTSWLILDWKYIER